MFWTPFSYSWDNSWPKRTTWSLSYLSSSRSSCSCFPVLAASLFTLRFLHRLLSQHYIIVIIITTNQTINSQMSHHHQSSQSVLVCSFVGFKQTLKWDDEWNSLLINELIGLCNKWLKRQFFQLFSPTLIFLVQTEEWPGWIKLKVKHTISIPGLAGPLLEMFEPSSIFRPRQ